MAVNSRGALPILQGAQAQASDPGGHVWLSASAGTGKTQVLTARVYRLLLRGVDPAAILCLTFTKAGAAEMAGRIGERLAAWVRMPETELVSDLRALGEDASSALRARARTLFARVLDAPGGGIRIQTIHGFCQSLLSAFPVEAGLAPGFRPIEAREEAVLAREALADMLLAAEKEGRDATVDIVGALSLRLGEGEAEGFLRACARAPAAMAELPIGLDMRAVSSVAALRSTRRARSTLKSRGACGDAMSSTSIRLLAMAAANRAWGTARRAADARRRCGMLDRRVASRCARSMLADLIAVPFTTQRREPRKYSRRA